jgi:hypothetical protein
MPPLNIHKLKEIEIIVAFANFGETSISTHLMTIT